MALPTELRQTLFRRLPFTLIENWPTEVLQLWLLAQNPALALEVYATTQLTEHEVLLKAAAWSGQLGYTNQLFLPKIIPPLLAARDGDLRLYADLSLRSWTNVFSLLEILQHTDQQLILQLLAYYASYSESVTLATIANIIIDYILLGRITLSLVTIRFLARSEIHLLNSFARGYLMALFPDVETEEGSFGEFFGLGYVLAGGKIEELASFESYARICARLNLPVPGLDDFPALEELADSLIALLPRTADRKISAEEFKLHSLAILRPRAQRLLELIPQIYAPSIPRERFLMRLRLVLNPATPGLVPADFGSSQIAILVGRFDLVRAEYTFIFEVVPYVEDVAKFLDLLIQFRLLALVEDNLVTHGVLAQAILTGQFSECATMLLTGVNEAVRIHQSILDFSTLSLDTYFNLTLNPHSGTIRFANSFLLQWLQWRVSGQILTFEQLVTIHEFGRDNQVLEFRYGNYLIQEVITTYEQELWQSLGLTVSAANLTQDPRYAKLAKYMALVQELTTTMVE